MGKSRWFHSVAIACFSGLVATSAWGFDSTSDSSDGALVLTTPGVVEFDPSTFVPPLDPDGDNIYHFTTITIAAGVTVRLSGDKLNGPVYWLASGAVQIDGEIDLNGEDGPGDPSFPEGLPAIAGAGGFSGGAGGTAVSIGQAGRGPGGGLNVEGPAQSGGGGGHLTSGVSSPFGNGGAPYGSDFLVPLVGGSGGAGGDFSVSSGGGGGAGGGALLLASSVSVVIEGAIRTNGGRGGDGRFGGGGGSGGSIRVASPIVSGAGILRATGGGRGLGGISAWNGGIGSEGRIRLEAQQQLYTGDSQPDHLWRVPYSPHLPANPAPTVRVATIDGVAVAQPSTGSFVVPDVTIATADPVAVVLEGRFIPLGTTVEVTFFSDDGATQVMTSSPLAGTEALSSATLSLTIPSGFTRGFARATWTP
ncbi:MAG: hypothetical protein K0U98_24510 [Deltaproteobacteria bacterium]|nr:hypothetical protein [Deltaproteobacteria bacterium]